MHLKGLLASLTATETFAALLESLQSSTSTHIPSQSIVRSARPYVIAALAQTTQRPLVVITARVDRAYDITEQLPVWLPETSVLRFQEPTALFYDRTAWTDEVIRSRLQTLASLTTPITAKALPAASEKPAVLVTSAYALMQKTLPIRDFRRGMRTYHQGQIISQETIIKTWMNIGYTSASVVIKHGTFSRRGGIVDVFPMAMDNPVRIEFFGDEIDSIRAFDPQTQRSTEPLKHFTISPAREVLPANMQTMATQLTAWFETLPSPEEDPLSPLADFEPLSLASLFPHAEFYLPYLYPQAASLLDYLPENALVVVDDWGALNDTVNELEEQSLNLREERLEGGQIPPDFPLAYHTWDDLQEALLTHPHLNLGQPTVIDTEAIPSAFPLLGDLFSPDSRYAGQLRMFLDALHELHRMKTPTLIVTRQAQRLSELWNEQSSQHYHPITTLDSVDKLESLTFVEGGLSEGWIFHNQDQTYHLFTDAEIFGWRRPEPRRRVQRRSLSPEAHFADLSEGDFVVHIDYGIGIFKGIHKRTLDGSQREYLLVEYAGGDVLYVPIHQADRLSRYVGGENNTPALNKLGSQDWVRTKKRTEEAVQEIADELLELYTARSIVQGFAFSLDTPWQHELEASFPYVETEDQLRALRAVKDDMESPRPMDRLICGDVGYGKTEVALRAAFKAVMDSKQVAVLVPTTVLAQQHYNTFKQRLTAFPVKVEMLSRFRSPKEQTRALKELAEGKIDIIIGTHRLLQEDVQFKNLGLLIIDEEQRFGVTHKENLKKKRTEVDVLTMTATPIPRTLYMGLTGVRDISLIQTAPQERLPVITHVSNYDEKIVRHAILRELDRGGQVFFVHNRVQTIASITHRLRQLVPEAKFIIGHGQMPDVQLEEVMTAFANGEYDVLVSTTIIESGLDIPNANTIIIDRADWFGLAQLYQIRGRVGRSANQAFAYFFHPHTHRLTTEARARLDTIAEYTDLGVGMSIAMRDLEIRGMGDLLGMQQSGHIEAVGFHLYTQLLAEAVHKVRTQGNHTVKVQDLAAEAIDWRSSSVTIDLPLPAYLPTDYIPEMNLRIQLYRRIASIEDEAALDNIVAELEDRFGKLPRAIQGLFYQIRVKLAAQSAGATAIANDNGKIHIKLPYLGSVDRPALQGYLGADIRVSRTAVWLPTGLNEEIWQPRLLEVLYALNRERIIELMYLDENIETVQ